MRIRTYEKSIEQISNYLIWANLLAIAYAIISVVLIWLQKADMIVLGLNIIEHPLENTNEISIIPQMIALDISFTYMLKCLNDSLQKHGIKKKAERYYMPVATACDTPYSEIICRILYYEQNDADMGFNILELSDRYFLIEYINLLQHGIEPHLLK